MERRIFLKLSGVMLIVLGVILALCTDTIFDYMLRTALALSPNSLLFESWKKNPVPLEFNFYLFNCTNCDEIGKDFKPEFTELGPYRFKEIHEKKNIVWNSNHTVSYQQVRHWYFDADNSNGTWEDKVTTINPVPLTSNHLARNWSALSSLGLSQMLRIMGSTIMVEREAGKIMFDGYVTPVLTMATTFSALSPIEMPYDRVGILYTRNDSFSLDGWLNVETGAEDPTRIGVVRYWNFKDRFEAFGGQCGQVEGSAGELFPPRQTRNSSLQVLIPIICRKLKFTYARDTEFEGIPAYLYEGEHTMFDNGHIDASNKCFCVDECFASGVQDISPCISGGPVLGSFPHFLHADPRLLQQVGGMYPIPGRHDMHITLEPRTGIPLDATLRIQVNMLLQRNPRISMYRDVPSLVFPVAWLESSGSMPSNYAKLFKLALNLPFLCICLSVLLVTMGVSLLLLSVWPQLSTRLDFNGNRRKRKYKEDIAAGESLHPLRQK